jgi:hypothetical protein
MLTSSDEHAVAARSLAKHCGGASRFIVSPDA